MEKINDKQLAGLVFMCSTVQIVSYEQAYTEHSPQSTIIAVFVKYVIFLLVLFILNNVKTFRTSTKSAWALLIVFTLSTAQEIVNTECFYSSVSENTQDTIIVFGIIFVAISCAVVSGEKTIVRIAQVAAMLFVLSIIVMTLSNIQNADIVNMQVNSINVKEVKASFISVFSIPAEALLFVLFGEKTKRIQYGSKIIILLFIMFVVISTSLAFVFGTSKEQYPLRMLTQIGSISVFRRLDSIYICVCLFAMLSKIACFCTVAYNISKKINCPKTIVPILIASFTILVFYIGSTISKIIITVIIAMYIIFIVATCKEDKHEM